VFEHNTHLEFGIKDNKPRGRKRTIKATKLSPREFEKQRAIALTMSVGVVELIEQDGN